MNLLRRLWEEDPENRKSPLGYFLTTLFMGLAAWIDWGDLAKELRRGPSLHVTVASVLLAIWIAVTLSFVVLWLKAEKRVRAEKETNT
jgi:uncharacterized protein with PQ loop repeat